ncbi:putative amino acid transporter protein [Neofusicoccum parvum UCRNP2]|uniref:Putative amino acid transporter protein n=1 Tax=Botryosphaeria parva (strain UCR-NP2) TaxID=1287680 RepID=R1G4Q0_BOTPV|nr:putative amino acid transporter protein [Neofusicoccum parvum UCRNP2]
MPAAAMANEGHPVGRTPRQPLRRELNKWQIFVGPSRVPAPMIVISTIIGVGFFTNSGEILSFAGPATTLLSFGVVGLLACMVMEGISEMVVIWPIPNPMVEFVRHFVDRDLANVVCFAYWYTYAISFAAVITTAGDVVVAYWGDGTLPKVLIFILFPIVVFLINFNSVSIFGWIEFAGGILKLAIGNAVYPYIGIEAVTITAFEARNPRELKMPAKNVAYIVTLIYLFSVLGFALNVEWGCDKLKQYYQQHFTTLHRSTSCHPDDVLSRRDSSSDNSTLSNQFTLPTIAVDQTQTKAEVTFSSFINVCLLYSALSTANSALFTASRTLYGLGQSTQVDSLSWKRATRFLATFGETNAFGVPARAIAASMSLAWVPLLSLDGGAQDTQQVLISIGSTSCVLVWASQSLAFVRYHAWLWRHRRRLVGPYARYDRWERSDLSSWLGFWQPALAWLSLVGCVLVVLVFASAGLWNGEGNC